jgi:DNA-binding NtrC family response regulator
MASAFQGRRIIVVEDEPLVTFLLEDALMIAGAQAVVQAARVAEALSAITTAMSEGGIDAPLSTTRSLMVSRPSQSPIALPRWACLSCS